MSDQPEDSNRKVLIRIQHLNKSFGSLKVLENANLEVFQGENLIVLGKSGAGKSVLIKLIIGLLRPDSGIINVLGQQIDQLKPKQLQQLRLKIGFSFQNSALYDSMTVRENLAFPLVRNHRHLKPREVNAQVERVLESVGLLPLIDQMPASLSGGQKKRVGIARTLILRPEIMLYDEPTSGLDPITSMEINSLINRVRERFNTTSIVITHDLVCAKEVGDRVIMLLDGKFEKQGTFEEIFDTDDDRIKSFYNYNFLQSKL